MPDNPKRTPQEIQAIREAQALDQSYAFVSRDMPRHWKKLYNGLLAVGFDKSESLELLKVYIRCMLSNVPER